MKGIGHRLFRSTLTLAVVVLAVAFFMFLLSENAFLRALTSGLNRETARRQFAVVRLGDMGSAPGHVELSRRLAAATRDPGRMDEFAAVAGWPPDRVRALAASCAAEQDYLAWFASLPPGKSAMLFGARRDRDIFVFLQEPGKLDACVAAVGAARTLRMPGAVNTFRSFATNFPALDKEQRDFAASWQAKVARHENDLRVLTGGVSAESWLQNASQRDLRAWHAIVTAAGFRLSWNDVLLVREQLRLASSRRDVLRTVSPPDARIRWQQAFRDDKPSSTDAQLLRLDDPRAATVVGNAFPPSALEEIARDARREKSLRALESRLPLRAAADAAGAFAPRQVFLLVISFIVCMVGIANAMLMAITERFREIATMKCLGATDRFILRLFMMEAALQGVAGGLAGTVVGFVVALARDWLMYGSHVFAQWPGAPLLAAAGISWFAGVALAIMASIYPTWVASRMVPMEAMRVE
jgi:hypothetical protein